MERDFMGINGKGSVSSTTTREDTRGSGQDSAFGGGPAVQWPYTNRISALQQFMSFRAGQEERAKKLVFDQLSSSGFQPIATVDAFEANYKASPVQSHQKRFALDRQGIHQFSMHSYQSQCTSPSGAQQMHHLHHSVPVTMSSPFFKVHGSPNGPNPTVTTLKQQSLGGGFAPNAPVAGSVGGAFTPRIVSELPAAQLTIFYAGSVNVYDDVPLDKAQTIMFMASKGSNTPSNAVNSKPEAPVPTLTKVPGLDGLTMNMQQIQIQTQTPNHVASPCSSISSPLSATSQAGAYCGSDCRITDYLGAKSDGPFPNNQHEPSKTSTPASVSAAPSSAEPRAIPQARKASLARFLEKRKERVAIAAPYLSARKTPENAVEFHAPIKSSSTDDCKDLRNLGS